MWRAAVGNQLLVTRKVYDAANEAAAEAKKATAAAGSEVSSEDVTVVGGEFATAGVEQDELLQVLAAYRAFRGADMPNCQGLYFVAAWAHTQSMFTIPQLWHDRLLVQSCILSTLTDCLCNLVFFQLWHDRTLLRHTAPFAQLVGFTKEALEGLPLSQLAKIAAAEVFIETN
jgi:hypothetical protein